MELKAYRQGWMMFAGEEIMLSVEGSATVVAELVATSRGRSCQFDFPTGRPLEMIEEEIVKRGE